MPGLAPGATEPDVRHAHDQHQLHWHGDRHNWNPQAVRNGGGTYVVAYGPIAFGVVRFFQGLFGIMSA